MTTETKKPVEGTQKADPMEIIALLLGEVRDLRTEMNALKANGGNTTKKGRAPRPAVRCMDTKTGNVYHSHASAGMAVAPEYGLRVHNFVWYEVIAKDKTRFQDISEDKYQAILKANAEKQEKQTATPPQSTPTTPPANTNQGKGK